MLGWIDLQAGKIADAIPLFQKANAEQASPLGAAELGYAYGASGDRIHAMAMIEELNKQSPHGYAQALPLRPDGARSIESLKLDAHEIPNAPSLTDTRK